MNFEVSTIVALGGGYLALLFGIAFVTERGWIPEKIVRHPIVYVLSLGVFASVWAYYTSIGNAQRDGYGYLAGSIGISLAFLLSPLLLRPLLELTRTYQLSSLARTLNPRGLHLGSRGFRPKCCLCGLTLKNNITQVPCTAYQPDGRYHPRP